MKRQIPLETYGKREWSDVRIGIAIWAVAIVIIASGAWFTAYEVASEAKAAELAPVIAEQIALKESAEKSADTILSAANRYAEVSVGQEATIKTLNEDNAALTKQLQARWISQKPKAVYVAHKPAAISKKMRDAGSGCERWRPIVARYFHGNTDAALRVMSGESGGNPNNSNGPCLGLFQIDKDIHADAIAAKAKAWGMKPNLYNPIFNIRFAAYMSNYGRNWDSWTVKP